MLARMRLNVAAAVRSLACSAGNLLRPQLPAGGAGELRSLYGAFKSDHLSIGPLALAGREMAVGVGRRCFRRSRSPRSMSGFCSLCSPSGAVV